MFISYDIEPVYHDTNGTAEPVESIEIARQTTETEGGAACWGLYGRKPDRSVLWIADRTDFESVAELYECITGLRPELLPGRHMGLPVRAETRP